MINGNWFNHNRSATDTIPAETLFNTTTEPLTVTYTAIATGDYGFDCEGLPTDYVVTVNPLAQVESCRRSGSL